MPNIDRNVKELVHQRSPRPAGDRDSDSAFASSLRDRMSNLTNMLRRCHSTVRGLRNSCAPISGFVAHRERDGLSAAPVESAQRAGRRPACVLSRLSPRAHLVRAPRTPPSRSPRTVRTPLAVVPARRCGGFHGAAIPRRRDGLVQGRAGVGCAPGVRLPPDTSAQRPHPRSAAPAPGRERRAPNHCRCLACAREVGLGLAPRVQCSGFSSRPSIISLSVHMARNSCGVASVASTAAASASS